MKKKLVLIGSSTGGPGQLKEILNDVMLPYNVSIVIAQHMSNFFMNSFVKQFNQDVKADVMLLDKKTVLTNKIYICAKNTVISHSHTLTAMPDESGKYTIFNPNVNMLFNSAIPVCNFTDVLAILMTGIGDDGASGLHELYKVGAQCIGENERDCIVYGMPKRARDINPRLNMGGLVDIRNKIERFINE